MEDKERESTSVWWEVLKTRLAGKIHTPVPSRIHEDDIIGFVIGDATDWKPINILKEKTDGNGQQNFLDR